MTEDRPPPAARALSGRTAWARSLQTPLRVFLRTETGSAAVLVAMTVAALVWINFSASSYEAVWGARLSVQLAGAGVSLDLREWVNSGLMTFFFFVFGLEARREFDMGELRQRRRLALPVVAGLGGLIVPVGIYLAFNHGPAARGWGAAMSTDTAFALGMLALVRPRFPDRVRAFLLSVAVVDDLVSLVVIGAAYSRHFRLVPLAVAAGVFAGGPGAEAQPDPERPHLRAAGDHGLGRGPALRYRPGRGRPGHGPADLRLPRRADRPGTGQRPVPQLPRAAHPRAGPVGQRRAHLRPVPQRAAPAPLPPLDQLRHRPAVRAGQRRDRAQRQLPGPRVRLPDHARHPDRVRGGKPAGIAGASWLLTRLSRGRLRPPVGWAAVTGVGTIAGIGFTVSILIATLAFGGSSSGSQARGTQHRAGRLAGDLAGVPGHRPAARPAADPRPAGNHPGHRRPRGPGRPRPRPHPRPGPGDRHHRRVRRLRMPLLRSGRAGASASSWPATATCATCGGTSR